MFSPSQTNYKQKSHFFKNTDELVNCWLEAADFTVSVVAITITV